MTARRAFYLFLIALFFVPVLPIRAQDDTENAARDIVMEEWSEQPETKARTTRSVRKPVSLPVFTSYAVGAKDFSATNVGGKSNNLKQLHGKLPEWVHLPVSVALPAMMS